MKNDKQIDADLRFQEDDALEVALIDNATMDQAVADGTALAISVAFDFARFYEGGWWTKRGTDGWVLAESSTAAILDRHRAKFIQADANVARYFERHRKNSRQ